VKNHKKSLLLLALLLLIVFTAIYIGITYSKYTAEVSGNGTATVAKWDFATDNAITTINVSLDQTPHASTLVSGKIAPGTSGSFQVHLSNSSSEVGADFTVSLGSITGKPTNLKFYKDSSYNTEITPGTTTITGQLAAGDSTGLDVPVYWKWDYYTSDSADTNDTADGTAASASGLTLPVTISGVQTQPSATAITSHIN